MNKKTITYLPRAAKTGKEVYMAIAAHQDDIEIMAFHGILTAFDKKDASFIAVVTTDGAGSARAGIYENYTDDEMKAIRVIEQEKAAEVGSYGKLYLLNYSSKEVKSADNTEIIADYIEIIMTERPTVIYTHNLADKHDTHIGVVTKVIAAIQEVDPKYQPKIVYGCEVWRDLDWVSDEKKIALDVSKHENLSAALLGVFDSQIAGGKRYDLATAGRRLANATYCASHSVDVISALSYAMDLTPLCEKGKSITEFISAYLQEFNDDVISKIMKMTK